MKPRPERWEPTPEIFDNLAYSCGEFSAMVRKHYTYVCCAGGYEPVVNDARLEDAFVSYQRDKKHAPKSMPGGGAPDHFKLGGILAYWLRRFAPVYDLRDLNMAYAPKNPIFSELLKKYPSELLAFDMGLAVCDFFESNKIGGKTGKPAVHENDFDYYKAVCCVMKFKNMSPHSMGMIYRSLYVPLDFAV